VIVHTFHGHVFTGYFGRLKSQVFLWLERGAARLTDVILTISPGLRDDLISYRVAPPNRIRVLPLGLDLKPFINCSDFRGAFRAELGIAPDIPLVGIVGRLVPVKNHDLFLAAAGRVVQSLPMTKFVVVGGGERLEELERSATTMSLRDHVIFTGWRDDLPAIYADLSLLVISSLNEGTPVSIIEAMAAGVPVVATAVGGVPDLLGHGRWGHLVPSGDVEALARAIVEALQTPDHDQQLASVRDYALHHYDAQRLAHDIRQLYLEMLKRKERTKNPPPPDRQ
jgi:glycosyltransferase involved in cell wall biosynthesis